MANRDEIMKKSDMVKKMTSDERRAYLDGLTEKLRQVNSRTRAGWNINNPFKPCANQDDYYIMIDEQTIENRMNK